MKLMVFDVGGTEIKYCTMDETLERLENGSVPTPMDTKEHFYQVLQDIFLAHRKMEEEKGTPEEQRIQGVAMSLPGFIDSEKGRNNGGGFMQYNQGVSIGPELSELLGVPVHLSNDGKAAAYAELAVGALKGCQNAAVYISGTGVGGGLIVNGQILNGRHFTAGEYSFLKTRFDRWNDFDASLAMEGSTRGLLKMYVKAAGLSEDTKINGKEYFAKVNAGDEVACQVLDHFSMNVAKAIFNINVLLDLEKVAIGGGISRQPILLEYIRKNMTKLFESNPFDNTLPRPEIVTCAYGNDANMIGAYMYYLKDMK